MLEICSCCFNHFAGLRFWDNIIPLYLSNIYAYVGSWKLQCLHPRLSTPLFRFPLGVHFQTFLLLANPTISMEQIKNISSAASLLFLTFLSYFHFSSTVLQPRWTLYFFSPFYSLDSFYNLPSRWCWCLRKGEYCDIQELNMHSYGLRYDYLISARLDRPPGFLTKQSLSWRQALDLLYSGNFIASSRASWS